jgi:hypothetical protein
MAEFNGKQGRWVTVEGRHLFIENGKDLKDAIKSAENKKSSKEQSHLDEIDDRYAFYEHWYNKVGGKMTMKTPKDGKFSAWVENYDTKTLPLEVDGHKILPVGEDFSPITGQHMPASEPRAFVAKIDGKWQGFKASGNEQYWGYEAYQKAVDAIKKSSGKQEDLVDKQEKDIAKHEQMKKELNAEKKVNDYETRKQELVDKYKGEFTKYLKQNNGKLPRKINMGTNIADRDAILTALNDTYKLSDAEDKVWDKIQFQNKNGEPYIWLPGKSPISTLGLSNKAISGLRKWLSVWGAEHLD